MIHSVNIEKLKQLNLLGFTLDTYYNFREKCHQVGSILGK